MTGMKNVFGVFVFLFLAAALFAVQTPVQTGGSIFGSTSDANTMSTIVTAVPVDSVACADPAQKCVLTATVLAFPSTAGSTGVVDRGAQAFYSQCSAAADPQACLFQKSISGLSPSQGTTLVITPVPNAKIYFSYINMVTGKPVPIDCPSPVIASTPVTGTLPQCDPNQPGCTVTYYTAQCEIPNDIRQGATTTQIQVTYLGGDTLGNNVTAVAPPVVITLNNPQPTAAAALTRQIGDLISGISQIQGSQGGTTPACVGVFLILGLLLASLYFSGKSPVSLLDITTPKLPAPKGVAAGGQILLPYGWSEMKGATKKKMASMGAAAGASLKAMGLGASSDPEKNVGNALNALNQKLGPNGGVSSDRMAALNKKLPYQYGDAEHRTVADILNNASKLGGREALMAATIKDYMMGQRTLKSLEAITGHKDIGVKSPLMTKADKLVNLTGLNANRYAVLGGGFTAGVASTVRTGQMLTRGAKQAVKGAPELGAAVAGTTMTMLTGRRLEDLARTSQAASWASRTIAARQFEAVSGSKAIASQSVIGTHYPIVDKMSALAKTLNKEGKMDVLAYEVGRLYKGAGLHTNMSEAELLRMGYTDVDILRRCGYTPALAAMDEAVRSVLNNAKLSTMEKITALAAVAAEHHIFIDPHAIALAQKLDSIDRSTKPADYYMKLGEIHAALENYHTVGMATTQGRHADEAYVCHVGADSITGTHVFDTMVFRTMVWDAEHGYLNGGIKEELLSARLNVVNRITGLDASSEAAMAQLPANMRNKAELEKLAARNKADMISLFTEEGRAQFQKTTGKTMNSASISELVNFTYGGGVTPKMSEKGTFVNGKMVWWGTNQELGIASNATLVDIKRHWVTDLQSSENFALGQWVESRFTKSYVPYYDAEIEARLNRQPGSANWSVEERTKAAKEMLLSKLVGQDMESRFNSQFAQNAYGTTHETLRFYEGQMAGLLKKVMQDKGMESNHPDLRNLERMDFNDPNSIRQFNSILGKYRLEVEEQLRKPITYDDVAKSKQAIVMLHEGGLAYYHKGMMLSDMDRVLGGEVALRDNKGQLRKYNPDDVTVHFGNESMMQELNALRHSRSKDPKDWNNLIEAAKTWKDEHGYSYEKQKIFGALLWEYGNTTHDYTRFWHDSAVTVEAKRQVTPLAPSPLRFFGAEAPGLTTMLKPWRDIGLHFGDYVSKVALASGGPVHKAAYDIAPLSEYYRQHSFQLSSSIMSGAALKGLTGDERVAYRAAAMDHFAYHQVWDYAIDRNPWRQSTSFGAHQSWGAFFHFGPAQVFDVKSNLGASMDKGQYRNFMAFYGFPMDVAGKILRPYTSMIRGMQMSMQGYASKWDATGDALKQWNYTQPRILEAMQSANPFSFKWFPGKTSERLQKLNVWGGSLETHQLAGSDFMGGLKQAPQDIFLNRKGVYASARTGEANPGVSHYNYRHELMPEAAVGEYMLRMKEGAFMYDERVREAAFTNTVRRTVSAEALAIRRDQELRSFGIMQNPLYGWASPIAALWHMPIPGTPSFLTPKDWVSGHVRQSKTGEAGPSFTQRIQSMADGIGKNLSKVAQPGQLSRVVYCPRCGTANMRGSNCKSCRQTQY